MVVGFQKTASDNLLCQPGTAHLYLRPYQGVASTMHHLMDDNYPNTGNRRAWELRASGDLTLQPKNRCGRQLEDESSG